MGNKHSNIFNKPVRMILLYSLLIIISGKLSAQSNLDSLLDKIDPEKLGSVIGKKVSALEDKVIEKSEKTLMKMQKAEEKVYRKMIASKDSIVAKMQLDQIRRRYASLKEKLKNPVESKPVNALKEYIPHLDTLTTALKFLHNQKLGGNIKDALSKVESFQGRLQQADEIKQFIKERKEQIKQAWESLGIAKNLKKINKEVYYYSQQIKEYKNILNDPQKIESKAIELLTKTKFFQDFMKKNSMLASLFLMPGGGANGMAQGGFAGLQTRAQISNFMQQLGMSSNSFQQNIQGVQGQVSDLRQRLTQLMGSSESDDLTMPDFKPNSQRVKSFFDRLQYGINFQSQKASGYFPASTDIGLSIGYKLNDKSVIGIGASYQVGWGSGWGNIKITHEGIGFRSFLDWKIKGQLWLSGGYERNYGEFKTIDQLRDLGAWQQSGLIGLSKTFKVRSKIFKGSKIQLLWDFLSYQQRPQTQPLVFRVGCSF